ncbi:MAG: TIGR01777 family oxidoreductase [Planctomycetota bacterium]
MTNSNRGPIVLAGGSGFLGRALAQHLSALGHEIITLTRSPRSKPSVGRDVAWDARSAGDWHQSLDGAAAVINLVGKNIDCRHTDANLALIRSSRVDATRAIGEAIGAANTPPPLWIQGSAAGLYGDVRDHESTEESAPGNTPLSEIAVDWEQAVPNETPGTRVCILRTGVVLGDSGALPVLAKLTRFGLGGSAGDGSQFMSWIHVADIVGIVDWFLATPTAAGAYNAVSPSPITNKAFMQTLRKVLKRPWSPPAPAFALRLGATLMGTDPSLALDSMRCVPSRLLAEGYAFAHTDLESALADLLT